MPEGHRNAPTRVTRGSPASFLSPGQISADTDAERQQTLARRADELTERFLNLWWERTPVVAGQSLCLAASSVRCSDTLSR